MRPTLLVALLLALGCAGIGDGTPSPVPPPTPAVAPPATEPAPEAAAVDSTDPAWVDAAVQEALDWEIMPGTSGGDEDPARAGALRTFFLAHPEYEDSARRELLAAQACGLDGTEGAHEYLIHPPPKTPVVVEVDGADWRILVPHANAHCTSDDWSWYSNEASEGAIARGAVTSYGGADNDVVLVKSGGAEVARIPLSGQGFLAARAGAEPRDLDYDPSSIEAAMDEYFGPRQVAPTEE